MEKRPTKGPVCGVENCRSRSYEEGEDGFLYCQNGHRQHGLIRGEDDEDNFSTATRTITRKKRDVSENETRANKHFNGRRALDLYLKSLQLILRHQIWFLVHEKGLPDDLETIVLDLWTLRIAQLGDKIASNDLETDSQSQSQVFNTLESEESETTNDERGLFKKPKGRDRKFAGVPNLKDCLALCYLGILTLRLPITPGDIYAWVTDGKMAYRRAIKYLPSSMRDRLPPTYHAALDPNTLLKYRRFYKTVTDLRINFEIDHGILWPVLNVQVLLYRYLKELALPLDLYDATIRLADLLGYEFALHHEGKKRLGMRHLPEAQLIGCLVVCVKLFYPFDDEQRYPKSSSEPAATILDWRIWHEQMDTSRAKQPGDSERLNTEELTKLKEKDVFSMQPHQIDQYLDFYSDVFLDEVEIKRTMDNDDFRSALYNMFPIEGREHHPPNQLSDGLAHHERLKIIRGVHSGMRPVVAVSDEEVGSNIVRPGEMYGSWKKEQDTPQQAKLFFEEVARLAGFSIDMLNLAVFFTEGKIEQWRRRQTRRQIVEDAQLDG